MLIDEVAEALGQPAERTCSAPRRSSSSSIPRSVKYRASAVLRGKPRPRSRPARPRAPWPCPRPAPSWPAGIRPRSGGRVLFGRCSAMYGQAPMLAGSSCTQISSADAGYRDSSAAICCGGQRIQPLQPDQRDVRCAGRAPPLGQVVVDLAGAEHDPPDGCRVAPTCARSPSTGWKDPVVKSAIGETAALSRSIDLGVNTISGLTRLDSACQRSRWK